MIYMQGRLLRDRSDLQSQMFAFCAFWKPMRIQRKIARTVLHGYRFRLIFVREIYYLNGGNAVCVCVFFYRFRSITVIAPTVRQRVFSRKPLVISFIVIRSGGGRGNINDRSDRVLENHRPDAETECRSRGYFFYSSKNHHGQSEAIVVR